MSWILPDVQLPAGKVRTIRPLDMRGSGASHITEQPETVAERAPDRAPMPVTTPSPARPAATDEEPSMELRSKVEAALKEHGPMSVKQIRKHVSCSWLAKLCSNLQRHGVIRKLGGGTRSGVYGLPGQSMKEAPEREPTPKAKVQPKKGRGQQAGRRKLSRNGAAPGAHRTAPAPRSNGHAAFAINEDGQLGLEKEGTKLTLDGQEFERLRAFIERTEPVWKGASA